MHTEDIDVSVQYSLDVTHGSLSTDSHLLQWGARPISGTINASSDSSWMISRRRWDIYKTCWFAGTRRTTDELLIRWPVGKKKAFSSCNGSCLVIKTWIRMGLLIFFIDDGLLRLLSVTFYITHRNMVTCSLTISPKVLWERKYGLITIRESNVQQSFSCQLPRLLTRFHDQILSTFLRKTARCLSLYHAPHLHRRNDARQQVYLCPLSVFLVELRQPHHTLQLNRATLQQFQTEWS